MTAERRANESIVRRLGSEAEITPQDGGAPYPCLGVYSLERNEGSGPATAGRPDPELMILEADDLPDLKRGDAVAVKLRGTWRQFQLVRPEPDDTGAIFLQLREQH